MQKLHRLLASDNNQDSDEIDNNNNNNDDKNIDNPASSNIGGVLEDWKQKWQSAVTQGLPEPIQKALTAMMEFWVLIRWHLVTFFTGAVLALTAIIVPLYNSVEPLSQPVTLFETILHDLDAAYVEPVDTNQLFETGVAAMLNSLDPYTEFENLQQAAELTESIDGKYGGVGLVIAGINNNNDSNKNMKTKSSQLLPAAAQQDNEQQMDSEDVIAPPTANSDDGFATPVTMRIEDDADNGEEITMDQRIQKSMKERIAKSGIRVVSAFEGYAFDYGMRVGDKIVAVDDKPIGPDTSVEEVRNALRGDPGSTVTIAFERSGVSGIQSITMPRFVVKLRDVKLATLLGNPADGIGYIQLSGFATDAGREMRNAITYLQRAAEDASHGERPLQGLIVDLRGNPGGLLTSAVDVASLLVPKGSDIVSAKGRGFPGLTYRSRVDPILDTSTTKLAVLVNGNTASAAEIVSGAVQDLDVGIIVGADRTFGKGLVQNVEELPYNTALKFTVAKYYTPSGRCIQGVNYKTGSSSNGADENNNGGRYVASKVAEKDRGIFYTRTGRVVRDGGGIEADFKVEAPKASALEITLLRSGVFNDFAAEWSLKHELTHNFAVDEDTYKSFQAFANDKQKNGEIQLEALYSKPLSDLQKALRQSGYKGSEQSVKQLQARIVREIQNDFDKYSNDIKEEISQSILARYLPESMLIERGVQSDRQVEAAVKLLKSRSKFDTLLAKGSAVERLESMAEAGSTTGSTSMNVASIGKTIVDESEGFRATITW
jgi:C-terminal peptidase prc